eukprot:UN19200
MRQIFHFTMICYVICIRRGGFCQLPIKSTVIIVYLFSGKLGIYSNIIFKICLSIPSICEWREKYNSIDYV